MHLLFISHWLFYFFFFYYYHYNYHNYVRVSLAAKNKQRLDLIEVLRSGDLSKVKAFIGDSLGNAKSNKSNILDERSVHMKELLSNQPLLHCCVGEQNTHVDNGYSKATEENRLSVAKYLLNLKNHSVSLGIVDDDGRTALHLAAKKEDSKMLSLLLTTRDQSTDRKMQLDINRKCNKSGWTPLHYAAGQGDLSAVKLLMDAGASLLVHAVSGKGATPLEVVKTRLQNAGHFSALHISNLQQVAKELSEAVRNLEKIKQHKEAERLLKEEKLAGERKKLAEREDKERELLERKQKQLKDKHDKDRSRTIEEDSKKFLLPQSINSNTGGTGNSIVGKNISNSGGQSIQLSLSQKELKDTKENGRDRDSPTVTPTSNMNNTSVDSIMDDPSKSAKKKKKKNKKEDENVQSSIPLILPPHLVTIGSSSNRMTVVDVASRDELVDHLLAMGFVEVDCLAALALYGKDLDRALSWLCDRPPSATTSTTTIATATSVIAITNTASVQNNIDLINPTISSTSTNISIIGSISTSSTIQSEINAENIRLQKEKDHKEELRRINRAWNQKAEEEKKRVSTYVISK